jgi:hypothetical protein
MRFISEKVADELIKKGSYKATELSSPRLAVVSLTQDPYLTKIANSLIVQVISAYYPHSSG